MAYYSLEDIASPPQYFNFATDVVDRRAKESPNLQALQWINDSSTEPESYSYGYFSTESKKAAGLLVQLGAKPGDRVMMMLNRVPAWWEIGTAAIRAGLVLCPCPGLATAKEIEFRLQSSNASIFVGNEHSLQILNKVRKNCPSLKHTLQADGSPIDGVLQYRDASAKAQIFEGYKTKSTDAAMIYFTSGTTGLPKMVLHTHSYPLAHIATATHWHQFSPGKTFWNLAEQGWAKAAWSWFSAWNTGAALFVQDSNKPFSAKMTLDVLHRYPITNLCGPPTAFRQMVSAEMQKYIKTNRPKALVVTTAGGEPLNPGVITTWKAMTGLEMRDGYGQTETILLSGNTVGISIKPGSMGKGVPGVPMHVVGDDGEIADPGTEGDLGVLAVDNGTRSSVIFAGYVAKDGSVGHKSRPRKENGVVTGEWYMTGDRAYRDKEGYFWFVGRSDDVINSSGYRIGPFEVESTLKLHPAVVESAVIGVKDDQRGEIVKAFVVLEPGHDACQALMKELQDHCKREAPPYKYPRSIEFVDPDWLPKTASGKIKRADLRKWEKSKQSSARL